jgi:RND family efflux transporter MFP subunit
MKKRYLIWLIIVVVIVIGFIIWRGFKTSPSHPQTSQVESSKQLYTCGMHPWVIQEGPGNCPICGMKLVPLKGNAPGESEQKAGERKILYWWDPMDPSFISDKPGKSPMGMDMVPVYEDQVQGKVISIDPVTVQNMGVRTVVVQRKDLSRAVITNGTVVADESKTFKINTKISGWIEKLYVNQTGQQVEKGQPLMDIYSPELVAAEQEYLLALKNSQLPIFRSSSGKISDSPELLNAAKDRLRYWDITDDQITELESIGKANRVMTIYSPASGIVMQKMAVEGGNVMAGTDLFDITDLSEVWVEADVYEYELPWVEVGQQAMVTLPDQSGKILQGKVSYIYPYFDPTTRTAKVRMVFPNPNLDLKLNAYADVQIETRTRENVLAIPREAVVRSGKRDVVFLVLGGGKFLPQEVRLGLEADGSQYEVLSGLTEGNQVVTSAEFLLDSESQLQEALQKLRGGSVGEAESPKVIGKEAQGETNMTSTKEEKSNPKVQQPADHVASGATMSQLFTADSLYWCPMHHDIVTPDGDSRCPICNMKLVKIPADSLAALRASQPYGCVMDPVVVPGAKKDEKCPICGMKLTLIKANPISK